VVEIGRILAETRPGLTDLAFTMLSGQERWAWSSPTTSEIKADNPTASGVTPGRLIGLPRGGLASGDVIAATITLAIIAGCGGGGGGSSSAPVTPPSEPPPPQEETTELSFSRDVSGAFQRSFGNVDDGETDESGGAAAADYDGDGDIDFYVVGGNTEPNQLYQNQGDGSFLEVAESVGLDLIHWGSGPAFGDIDGDGDLDLFIGAVNEDPHYVFENRINQADARFVDVTADAGITFAARKTVSAIFFDYDSDGFLDLIVTHWNTSYEAGSDTETLWRNNGDRTFTSTSIESGVAATLVDGSFDYSFTPNFSDIDGDGIGDLLMTSDFNESQVFLNNAEGSFLNITNREVIKDQAGMGAAVGDYDNDGDMDWFVTSIYNGDGVAEYGNRLYRNDGTGTFEDVTVAAGVQDGGWGWGACTADFDNDGALDIVHVNGWGEVRDADYRNQQVRFFHNIDSANLVFDERAEALGLTDRGQGRGLACFDADRDGFIDLVITNNEPENIVFYRNDTDNGNHYLGVKLQATGNNRLGVGALITVSTDAGAQVRELGGSNNYVSHNPLEVHFGLAAATTADVTVRWPDGNESTTRDVAVDQIVTISQ